MSEHPLPIFLTPREQEIIYALVLNFTKKQLADYFQLSEETIEKYIKNINEKLDKVQSSNYYLYNENWNS
jgi:DNA-binding NarL/FixJ family response regulator